MGEGELIPGGEPDLNGVGDVGPSALFLGAAHRRVAGSRESRGEGRLVAGAQGAHLEGDAGFLTIVAAHRVVAGGVVAKVVNVPIKREHAQDLVGPGQGCREELGGVKTLEPRYPHQGFRGDGGLRRALRRNGLWLEAAA